MLEGVGRLWAGAEKEGRGTVSPSPGFKWEDLGCFQEDLDRENWGLERGILRLVLALPLTSL